MRSLVNGQAEENISIRDRGLQYGDGLFETLAVENGIVKNWELHWARLCAGCERLFIPQPNELQVLSEIEYLLRGVGKELVKIIITRGAGARGYAFDEVNASRIVSVYDWPVLADENTITGIELFLCQTRLAKQPLLAGIKHLNRLENILARHEWQSSTYAEGIMLDSDGNVIEGTMSNVFLVRNSLLQTPDLNNSGVRGITRQRIIDVSKQEGITLQQTTLGLDDLFNADEVFVCNTVIGIWPVKKAGEKQYLVGQKTDGTFHNPVTRLMQTKII